MSASPGRTDYTQTASQELFLRKKILGTPSRRTLVLINSTSPCPWQPVYIHGNAKTCVAGSSYG